MDDVFGMPVSRLRERVGTVDQVLRVDRFVELEGSARGARRFRLVNGGGIEVEVHPDRALDLGQVTVDGVPIAWMSPTGMAAPQFYEPEEDGWLRTFGGGLLATCGLDTFGPPGNDDGVDLGLHGRIGTRPATVTRAEASRNAVIVEGRVRQAAVFGENLTLHRRISSGVGSDVLTLEDVVTNEGFETSPHMILYHVNLGWPLLDEASIVDIPSTNVEPRDEQAQPGIHSTREVPEPTPGFREQVYRHDFEPDQRVTASVWNPRLGLGVHLHFTSEDLPALFQWKMVGQGTYVMGLEPTNCPNVFGREAARHAGQLPVLEAGESVSYRLDFEFRRQHRNPEPSDD